MAWAKLSADDKANVLARAKRLGLTETNLSSSDDLIVGRGGVNLDPRQGTIKFTKVHVKTVDDLVRLYGHPSAATSTRLAMIRMNERRTVLRNLRLVRPPVARSANDEGRALNQVTSALLRGSMQVSEIPDSFQPAIAAIASKVLGFAWFFPNIVIESNCTLSFSSSGPHSLIANKITIEPGGRIVADRASVSISCRALEVQ